MRIIILAILLSTFFYSCADAPEESDSTAQEKTIPQEENLEKKASSVEDEQANEDEPETIMDFTPEGYVLYKTYKGDLNRDEHEDMIAVFDAVDNEEMINRAVMVLTTDKDGKLKAEALNKDGAYCHECGGMMGDPLANVVIKNGYFTIEHFGGSRTKWTDDPTFKYNEEDGKWYLHRHSKMVHDGLDPENGSSETMLTTKDFGVINFEDFKY